MKVKGRRYFALWSFVTGFWFGNWVTATFILGAYEQCALAFAFAVVSLALSWDKARKMDQVKE